MPGIVSMLMRVIRMMGVSTLVRMPVLAMRMVMLMMSRMGNCMSLRMRSLC